MIRINVGGLAAQEIRDLAAEIGRDAVDVKVTTDIAGAKEVAQGQADYYLGACATGGGGALAMAIAILGFSNCFTASPNVATKPKPSVANTPVARADIVFRGVKESARTNEKPAAAALSPTARAAIDCGPSAMIARWQATPYTAPSAAMAGR